MESILTCGKKLVAHADISGSEFHSVNLSGAVFDDVNLGNAKFHNINFSDARISAANLSGATFKHIGPPPDSEGRQARQRPVTFEEAMLCDSTFRKVDLSNVRIVDCNMDGMTIDGIPVVEMLKAYRTKVR